MNLETFAAERDEELTALALLFAPAVAEALTMGWDGNKSEMHSIMLTALDAMFTDLYVGPDESRWSSRFLQDMEAAVEQTIPVDSEGRTVQVQRISGWFATATINASALASGLAAGATKTWVTMLDRDVRELHTPHHSETIAAADTFNIGGFDLSYPGQPVGPPEVWINCRCVLFMATSLTAGAKRCVPVNCGLTAAADGFDGIALVAIPEGDRTVTYEDGDSTQLHQTLAFLGDAARLSPEDRESVLATVEALAKEFVPFTAQVAGRGTLGENADEIAITEAPELQGMHDQLLADPLIARLDDSGNDHPTWISHITGLDQADTEVTFDRVGAWFGGDDHTTFDLTTGVAMSNITLNRDHDADDLRAPVSAIPNEEMQARASQSGSNDPLTQRIAGGEELSEEDVRGLVDWFSANDQAREAPGFRAGEDGFPNEARMAWDARGGEEGETWATWLVAQFDRGGSNVDPDETRDPREDNGVGGEVQGEDPVVAAAPPEPDELIAAEDGNQPWHGTLLVEGVETGDGRLFARGSTTWAEPPLHLRYVRSDVGEHQGAVTVGKITAIERVGDEILAEGELFPSIPETNEVILLMAEGLGGVSLDADSAEVDVDELEAMMGEGVTEFTGARLRAATVVAIPALVEASLQLGPRVAVDNPIPIEGEEEGQLVASAGTIMRSRGSGWVTHPKETRRIHAYWTRGEGAAKIRWGTGGDFTRCTRQLRKYIDPVFLNRTCAEWHNDALGYWPGEKGKPGNAPKTKAMITALSLVASAETRSVPVSVFADAVLDQISPLSFTLLADGRYEVIGHAAQWGTCHIGIDGVCIEPPPSPSNYAYFHTGSAETDDGDIACGVITMNTGHAAKALRHGATVAHYDNTGTIAMKLRAGEDDFGIWIHGVTALGLTDIDIERLMLSAPSGDWREIGGHLELVAALAVNTPGYPVPRVGFAVEGTKQTALVAAGIVTQGVLDVELDIANITDRVQAEIVRRDRLNAIRRARRIERLAALRVWHGV